MTDRELIHEAYEARKMSYCPYSEFAVGAAILAKSGKVYRGCNIENAGYNPTNCAERTAIFKAVSEGDTEFVKIAIIGGNINTSIDSYAYPCGPCRQVMREFCDPDSFRIIVAVSEDKYEEYFLKELLPKSFGPEYLQ